MYKDITEQLMSRGFTVTPQGCRRKYNKLLARYKKVKDNNSRTGKHGFMNSFTVFAKKIY